MLTVTERGAERLREALDHAIETQDAGGLSSLVRALAYVDEWGNDPNRRCDPAEDATRARLNAHFAPLSFGVVIDQREAGSDRRTVVLIGGLIYSGPGQPSDGSSPSFTVSLEDDAASGRRPLWRLHT